MAEAKESLGFAWGTLVLRFVLGGFLLAHGVLRLIPPHAQKETELVLGVARDALGQNAPLVVIGAGEIFVGVLLVIGLFVRLALLPLIAYAFALVFHVMKKQPLVSPEGSIPEEYLVILGVSFALMLLGPGRYSAERFLKSE